MIDYEEPLVSGIHAATAPQVAAALHATVQLLNFYSFVLGRRVEKRFKMSDLFEAEEEFGRLICPLSDGDRRAAYETIIKVLVQSIRSRFSADAALHAEASDGESIDRVRFRKFINTMSPLLDGYDITDAGQQAFSKRLVEGVAALDAGELPDVFKPASRRRKYVKSYLVSLIQYEFFLMRRLLSRAGFNVEEIRQIFGKHAKANWDTISRWPKKIRAVVDGEKLNEIEDKVNKLGKTKTMRSKDGAESAMKKLETRYFEARQTGG